MTYSANIQNKKLLDILHEEETRLRLEDVQDNLDNRLYELVDAGTESKPKPSGEARIIEYAESKAKDYIAKQKSFEEGFNLDSRKAYKEIVPIVNEITKTRGKIPELLTKYEELPDNKGRTRGIKGIRAGFAAQTIVGSGALFALQTPLLAGVWAGSNALMYGLAEYLQHRQIKNDARKDHAVKATYNRRNEYIFLPDRVEDYKIPEMLAHEYAHHLTTKTVDLRGNVDIFDEGFSTAVGRLSSVEYAKKHDLEHLEYATIDMTSAAIESARKLLETDLLHPESPDLDHNIETTKYVLGEALFKAQEQKYGKEIYVDVLRGKNVFS